MSSNLVKNTNDLDNIFESRVTTAISGVNIFSAGTDISNFYERVSNGSNVGVDTGFVSSGTDIRNLFAAKGTVTGSLFDLNGTFLRITLTEIWDGKVYNLTPNNYTVAWSGSTVFNAAAPTSGPYPNASTMCSAGGYSYTSNTTLTPDYTSTVGTYPAETVYRYFKVARSASTPMIQSFTASYTAITVGASTTLNPVFSGGTGSISPAPGAVTSGTGYSVSPTTSTTYTLTVGGSVSSNLTVTVYAAPTISSFAASPNPIDVGMSSVLSPVFTSPGSSSSNINQGVGTVVTGGNYTVFPTSTTTYTLTAYNGAQVGTTWVSQNVTVTVYALPAISSFTASPSSIYSGNTATLYPIFTGGTGIINPGGISVTSGGAYPVTPGSTTTYTLTVTNPRSTQTSATVTVTVSAGCGANCRLDGACCPDPWVLIWMADGSYKMAGDLRIGDWVVAWNERLERFESEMVVEVENSVNWRHTIELSNGQSGKFASNHRLLTSNLEWKELRDLLPGEELFGGISVVRVYEDTLGPVVKFTVNDLHTYVSLGVVSHNLKGLT